MTNIYRVRSHNKTSVPDGRELVFSGTPEQADNFYNNLTNAQRCTDRYLFGDEDSAVDYTTWMEAEIHAALDFGKTAEQHLR